MIINADGVELRRNETGIDARSLAFTVVRQATARHVGDIELRLVDDGCGQIRYRGPSDQPGVAEAAVRALADWAYGNGFARLEIAARREDARRVRIALASGFRFEGVRRNAGVGSEGTRHDVTVFARLADDPSEQVARALPDFPGGRLTDSVIAVRPLAPADVGDYLALEQLPEVARYHLGEPITEQVATVRCATAEFRWLVGEMAECVIIDATTGAFAGTIQLINREPFSKTMMLGYALQQTSRGKGIATRAVNLLAAWAFSVGAIRVTAGTFPENLSSQAVLRRAGFALEAVVTAALPGPDGSRIDNVHFVRISPRLSPESGA